MQKNLTMFRKKWKMYFHQKLFSIIARFFSTTFGADSFNNSVIMKLSLVEVPDLRETFLNTII